MAAIDRDKELSTRADIRDQVLKIAERVGKRFEKQRDRAENSKDNWDAYNCELSDKQFYNGTSKLYLPFIHDAVEARKTRFGNQLFPQNQKHVEVTTMGGEQPYGTQSLLEHYISSLQLHTQIVEPMLVNGDLEGQYTIYVSWEENRRYVTRKVKRPVEMDGIEIPEDIEPPVDDMEDEREVVEAGPSIEVISDSDVVIFPETAKSPEAAVAAGGFVAIARRWTKAEIKRKRVKKEIPAKAAERLEQLMGSPERGKVPVDTGKIQGSAAGIKVESGDKIALVFEVWSLLKIEGEYRICRFLWAGGEEVLTVKRNPYWCDRLPILSCAVDKTNRIAKGKAPADPVLDLQVLANDVINEAADSAHFSALPIIMTDPEKNPQIDSLVFGLGAIWKTDPQSTQFAKFPEMWKDGLERAMAIRGQIFQTLGVNPAMIPAMTGGKNKRNQAEVAQEQQVDILTTAAAVKVVEQNILTPLLTLILEFDHQFRSDAILIPIYGPVGRKVQMEELEPQQVDRTYKFRWFGVEAAQNAARMQQQIAGVNVLRGIPPQAYPGYKLNLAPVISSMVESLFGPVIGPQVFTEEAEITVDAQVENDMMVHGFDTPVHPADNDVEHLQAHMQAVQQTMDPHGTLRKHIAKHQQAAQMKAQAQMAAQQQRKGGAPGAPGPAPGGQPMMPQSQPGAPGGIHPDQMARAGAVEMPRKM